MNRRDLIRLAATAACATTLPRWAWSATVRQRDLFPLGVASGAPSADGFVLWTRLLDGPVPGTGDADAPRHPLQGALTVRWEVAEDEAFRSIVKSGQTNALPALDHSVHVEVSGLKPDHWYFYRFMHGDAVTATARTRTFPAADAMVDRLRFAFVSCQRWEQGYYAGYRHMLAENLDLVVFLGDYIYEYGMPTTPKKYVLARRHSLAHAYTLDGFRDRYALYKTDLNLQAAHRACPWLVSWDDHDVENDYAGVAGIGDPKEFLQRRNAGYQAFYENMPLRASALTHGTAGLGSPSGVKIYDRSAYGRLANFHMLDTRQYRDYQACRVMG